MRFKRPVSVILDAIARRTLRELLRITCIFLFTPFIVITLAPLYIYRRLVEIVLKIQFGGKFVGFLKGTDCIWAIEDTVSLSVINTLMILEKTARNTNAIFLQDFRKLLNHRIVSRATGTTLEKLFYQRSQKFGYYFWKRNDELDLEQRIRWLECEDINCDGSCEDVTSETFRRNLGNACNKPLPDDHTAAWEILVGRRCARSTSRYLQHVEEGRSSPEERFNTDVLKIPVIFRVHHSLGDGVALLGLLLKAIAEEDEAKVAKIEDDIRSISKNGKEFKEIISPSCDSKRNSQDKAEITRSYQEDILAASMPFTYVTSRILRDIRNHFRASLKLSDSITIDLMKQVRVSIERTWLNFKNTVLKRSYKRIEEAAQLITIALSAPERFIQQAIRSMDENALHGPPQTGKKIVFYWLEDVTNDESQKLLTKIREIRRSTGTGFGDVVLAAFSVSVHKYHLRIDKPVPEALTAILPIRMAMPDENMTLDNNFSVALLRVCISSANGRTMLEPNENSQFFERLRDIARASNELKRSPDSLLNFWFMKYLSAILPVRITRALLSSQSTMVFSNMYGPQRVRILDSLLSTVAFWIPNKFRISSE
ncbi:hypothetical protein DMN91_010848 [Ooceraea biroi]|uniref:O-acyltransferase WSD1 C-terminal domain-containing protein n=1 Tax=Ooceraea biroi TaxID=2015173 RepID=A0A3L8D8E7_OOCBI|nr:hypothetical protein DMN91_010848 [Ooceraea biroi]